MYRFSLFVFLYDTKFMKKSLLIIQQEGLKMIFFKLKTKITTETVKNRYSL